MDLLIAEIKYTVWTLVWHQMMALIIKRFHHISRDWKAFVCEVVLPAGFILLAMAFALAIPPVHPEPPLEIQPWMYEPKNSADQLNVFYRYDSAFFHVSCDMITQ